VLSDLCGLLSELLDIFESAASFLRRVRWSGGVRGIYCGFLSVIGWGWYRGVYSCLRTFNDKSESFDGKPPRLPSILEFSDSVSIRAKSFKDVTGCY
jgi:hypothetical protein